jgi:hypothetical protein
MAVERRRDDRVETRVTLSCRIPARPRASVIHDLSHTGCRLELPDASAARGGTVLLDVPGGRQVSGQIVWVKGNEAGVQFDRWLAGPAAVALGLDEAPPEPVTEAIEEPNLSGLLRHWIRRLTGREA